MHTTAKTCTPLRKTEPSGHLDGSEPVHGEPLRRERPAVFDGRQPGCRRVTVNGFASL